MRPGVIGNGQVLLKRITCPVYLPKTLSGRERSSAVRFNSSQLSSVVLYNAKMNKARWVEPLTVSRWPRRLASQRRTVSGFVVFSHECPSHRCLLIQASSNRWPLAGRGRQSKRPLSSHSHDAVRKNMTHLARLNCTPAMSRDVWSAN